MGAILFLGYIFKITVIINLLYLLLSPILIVNIIYIVVFLSNWDKKYKSLLYSVLIFFVGYLVTKRTVGFYQYDDFYNHINLFNEQNYSSFIFVNFLDIVSLTYLYIIYTLSYNVEIFLFLYYIVTISVVSCLLYKTKYFEICGLIFVSPLFIQFFFQFPRQNIAIVLFIISYFSCKSRWIKLLVLFTHFYGGILLLLHLLTKYIRIKKINVFWILFILLFPYFMSLYFVDFFIWILPHINFSQILQDKFDFFITFSNLENSASLTNFKILIIFSVLIILTSLIKLNKVFLYFDNQNGILLILLSVVFLGQLGSQLMAFVLRIGLFSIVYFPLVIIDFRSFKLRSLLVISLFFFYVFIVYQTMISDKYSFEYMYFKVFCLN